MTNIDLHTHSVYSDGTYTPAEIVNYAKEKGLSAVSLTDHDTIDGLDEARMRTEHNNAILKALHAIGIEIDYVDLEMQSPKGTVTRLNIAKTLVQKGYAKTVKDALHRYFNKLLLFQSSTI